MKPESNRRIYATRRAMEQIIDHIMQHDLLYQNTHELCITFYNPNDDSKLLHYE